MFRYVFAGTARCWCRYQYFNSRVGNERTDQKSRIHEELASEISDNLIKNSALPQLPYLPVSKKKTERLHPPTPLLLPRRASVSCEIMNYTIPKDSQIWANDWAIGRDPMNWEGPLVFKPERFLN